MGSPFSSIVKLSVRDSLRQECEGEMALDFLLNVSGPELHDAVLRAFLEQALDCLYGEPSIVQLAGVAEGLSEKAGAPRRCLFRGQGYARFLIVC